MIPAKSRTAPAFHARNSWFRTISNFRRRVRAVSWVIPPLLFAVVCGQFFTPLHTLQLAILAGLLRVTTSDELLYGGCTLMDIAVQVFAVSVVVSGTFVATPASIDAMVIVAVGVALYFVLRCNPAEWYSATAGVVAVLALYLGITALGLFGFGYMRWRSANFPGDLTTFKVYTPLLTGGISQSDHIFLFLLLFACLTAAGSDFGSRMRKVVLIAQIFMLACVIVSFSRALYASFLLMLFGLAIFLHGRRFLTIKMPAIWPTVLSVSVVVGAILWRLRLLNPFLTTLLVFKTTSQVRSALARTYGWELAWRVFKEHPFVGVGSRNFALFANSMLRSPKDQFVGQSFNFVAQTAAEQGVLGLCALALFFVVICKVWRTHFVRRNCGRGCSDPSHQRLVLICVGVTAALFYNLWESAWLSSQLATGLVFAMLASVANFELAVRHHHAQRLST